MRNGYAASGCDNRSALVRRSQALHRRLFPRLHSPRPRNMNTLPAAGRVAKDTPLCFASHTHTREHALRLKVY